MAEMSREEVMQLIAAADWRQKWEIIPGVWTPGISDFDAKYLLDEFGVPEDLTGKTCLDIGAWDGPITFELERRGAKVIATDIQDPDATGFNVARRVLGSKAEYVQASVYDLPDVFAAQFDVVVFRAVYYHLKNPFGAFEAIGRITRENGLLCTEGEALRFYAETLEGKPRFDEALRLLAEWDIPVMLFYPGNYKSGENWNVPNLACFKGWMQASGFDITKQRIWEDFEINGQRLIVSAKRNANEVAVEHSVLKKGWRNEARGEVVKGQFIQADRLDTLGKALKDD
jgi:SAM-dependent methyltransferase